MTSAAEGSARRRVLALAVPALGALAAEPLFVMVDSAIVGHLGRSPLAGLALAGAVLNTCVNLCVFLAYATTSQVAHAFGRGDLRQAARLGMDALYLALGLGLAAGVALFTAGPTILGWFGAGPEVQEAAVSYLRWSAPGLPAMLVLLAATGVLRGWHNTKVTFQIAVVGGVVDALTSFGLCYPGGMGIRGAALGTVVSQLLMALWAGTLVVGAARREGAGFRPHRSGVWSAARTGAPLFVRTCLLRAASLVALGVATSFGAAQLAAHQIVANVWLFSSLCTDALAIAAQTLVGTALGSRDTGALVEVKREVVRLSVGSGGLLGVLTAALAGVLPWFFTPDAAVRAAATGALLVVAVGMPLGGWAYALDGILLGAGQGGFLAGGMALALVCYLP
ncbi:MAG: MATE family efflux transporter, partial [Bifidobacteriaceae bacterium]|nr:MATE family efflux transporter [Bifidobacteriaceae bacterium]